jgi:hypothetical protein
MIVTRSRKDVGKLFAPAFLVAAAVAMARASAPALAQSAPSLLTPAEAQQQVRFTIAVPKQMPAGSKLQGVRVFPVNVQPVPSGLGRRRKPIKQRGYGVFVEPRGELYNIEAYPGSPAEKDGLSSAIPLQLLTVNGRPITVAEQSKLAALPPKQRYNRQTPTLVNLLNAAPPIKLGVKDASGAARTVVLIHDGAWYLRTNTTLQIPVHDQMRASLLYTIHGKQMVIAETRIPVIVAPKSASYASVPPGTHRKSIGGSQVIFYGPSATPNAMFHRNGIEYDVYNIQNALTEPEEEAMIASM